MGDHLGRPVSAVSKQGLEGATGGATAPGQRTLHRFLDGKVGWALQLFVFGETGVFFNLWERICHYPTL